ncbi:hypothetical protein [Chitinophaga qingshengii]|uniref:Right-handed parallel beta-helix repeat-containing protein n=1 Tax=Chitinophaga qingshengii TaxID=1569794 RepID=A0ABR7TLZ0_9BACT|nr:hypothetical protein [Chitinophaga qingshengii]MBC9930522.1 hypothetical protein [Chitinophaga qingshengii]
MTQKKEQLSTLLQEEHTDISQPRVASLMDAVLTETSGDEAYGDMYARAADGTMRRIPIGTVGQQLTVAPDGFPAWANDITNTIVVNAGQDQNISAANTNLQATASDVNSAITSYHWTKQSGPVEPIGTGFNGGSFTPLRTRTFTPSGSGDIVFDNTNTLPGDLIILDGNFRSVRLDSVQGTAANPIVFRNPEGQITRIGNTTWAANGGPSYALQTSNSKHFIFAGTHWNNLLFTGSEINTISGGGEPYRSAYRNLSFDAFSEKFEICYFTVTNGGTCIVAKTDPVAGQSATWYPNTTLQDILIHDFIIDNPYNEGLYIGHTATYWDLATNTPHNSGPYNPPPVGDQYKQPIMINNVKVWNGRILNTGKDGIQISACRNIEVYQNEVFNWASVNTNDRSQHNGGILIGGRAETSNVHDNITHDSWGEHFQFYGTGAGHIFKNNLCYNTDAANANGDMAYISARSGTNDTENHPGQVTLEGNTFSRSHSSLVRVNGYYNKTGGASGTDNLQVIMKQNLLMAPLNNAAVDNYDSYYVYTENPQDYGYSVIVTRPMAGVDANVQYQTVAIANVDTNNYYLPNNSAVTQGFRKTKPVGPQVVSGASVIVTPDAAATAVTNMVSGVYVFRVVAGNALGQYKSDTVQVTVVL